MDKEVTQTLKTDLCEILRSYSEKGITNRSELEGVKIALSALQKLLTIEAMERVGGYSGRYYCDDGNSNDRGNSYRRDSRGRYYDDGARDNGYSNHNVRDQIQNMMQNADAREREILEKMLRQL